MKAAPLLVAVIIATVALGCGGSGGGGGTSTGTTGTTGTNDTITTAIVAESQPGVQVDPTNLQVGDTVTFHLAQIDLTAGTYQTVTSGGFTTTDTTGAAGQLNIQTGQFTAQASTNGKTYTISTSSLGKTYTALYAVTPIQGRVTGQVIDTNGKAVEFPVVLFYDSSGQQVGSTTATVAGKFNGSVPLSGVRFNLQPSSLSTSHYYEAFSYGVGSYGPLVTGCNAPLPALSSGKTSVLSAAVIVAAVSDSTGAQNTPPPPPTCSP